MNDLLELVLDAHGGLGRWWDVSTLTATLAVGGPFWKLRGFPDAFLEQTLTVSAHREYAFFTPWITAHRSLIFDTGPEQVTLRGARGHVIRSLVDPRPSYAGYDPWSPWDALQVGYFLGYATWNYLTTPFLLTYPGVHAREISPRREDGQTWRRLLVTFPAAIATHSAEQIFYFGDHGLLRRVDYAFDISGGALIADYAEGYQSFDGFAFPTRRRIYDRNPDGTADQTVAQITLDIQGINVA